jgi:hypothetical protein
MESSRPIRSFLALLAVAVFAACGGGGGSMSPSTGSGGANPTTPNSTTTTAKTQSAANSALSVTGNSLDIDQFGSSGSITSFAIQRAIAARDGGSTSWASPGSCQNGVEYSQTSPGSGQYNVTIEFFYDNACTQPRKLVTMAINFSSTGGIINGTEELWDMNGNVVDYKTDEGTFAFAANSHQITQITVERTVAAQPSATPFSESGFTCIYNTSSPVDCGNAVVATINDPQIDPQASSSPGASPSASPTASPTPYEIGFAGTVQGQFQTPSPSPSPSGAPTMSPQFGWNPQPFDLQLTITGTGYTGATQSMTIAPATAPAWSITGGTQITTLSGTATIGFGPSGMMSNANITLVDSADGLTITLTSIAHGGLSGNVTNSSGQTVATVTVDANGDGTIDYTSGAMAQIRDWVILSS